MLELKLAGLETLIDNLSYDIASHIENNSQAVIDFDTADFDVDGKEIKLVGVNLEELVIKDLVEDILKDCFKEYLED